jgi:hypothetical protein
MAEIDDALPNSPISDSEFVEKEIPIENLNTETTETTGDVEVLNTEDGGAEISFNPNAQEELQTQNHFDNLAELLDDDELDPLASELFDQYTNYKESRGDWEETYRNGLNLLGFKYESRTEPFRGAAAVTHPVLAEAVTQFQAQAYKELLPADGPVRAQILGTITPEKQDQANRVKDFMNYQIMDQMKEYETRV